MTSEEAPVNGLEQFKQLVLPLGEAYIHSGLSYHAIRDGSHLRILHARLFLQSRPTGIPQKVVCFQDQEVGILVLTKEGLKSALDRSIIPQDPDLLFQEQVRLLLRV